MRAGLKDVEIARRLGITIPSYCELESYDSEAFQVASLKDVADLGRILGVQPSVLLLGDDGVGVKQTVSFPNITASLNEEDFGKWFDRRPAWRRHRMGHNVVAR